MQKASSGRFSLTHDSWTATNATPYLAITCHFIHWSTWEPQSFLLGFVQLLGNHTAAKLRDILMECLIEYDISTSIRSITVDSASNNTLSMALLEEAVPPFSAANCHVRCIAHTINLAVQAILQQLNIEPPAEEEEFDMASNENVRRNTTSMDIATLLFTVRRIVVKI